MDSVLVVYCGVQESCQGVFPLMEACVFPAGNFEDLTGNVTLNLQLVATFYKLAGKSSNSNAQVLQGISFSWNVIPLAGINSCMMNFTMHLAFSIILL